MLVGHKRHLVFLPQNYESVIKISMFVTLLIISKVFLFKRWKGYCSVHSIIELAGGYDDLISQRGLFAYQCCYPGIICYHFC